MPPDSSSLSSFLSLNRVGFLDALRKNRGHEWTVVIGNEAGDLDSCASSIAYSYFSSIFNNRPTVALLQTPRADLHLRAENLYAYEIARLHPTQADLLCIDDIPEESLPHVTRSPFVLVDHNRLLSRFTTYPFSTPPDVVAIIDHHEDEGFHESADPRIVVVPVGSCSSLLTKYFANLWEAADHSPPAELATLLLAAIFIDTNGLKPKSKAEPIDHESAAFLIPRSTFGISSSPAPQSSIGNTDVGLVIKSLKERKESVSHLSTRDLLRRDYKEYQYKSPYRVTNVGLATVPQNPEEWFQGETSQGPWLAMDTWMEERGLDVLGVLYTYSRNGKHERQGLWIVKKGSNDVRNKLWEGLETSEQLKLERRPVGGSGMPQNEDFITPAGGMARLWFQGNHKVTRKVVAPRVKELLESL